MDTQIPQEQIRRAAEGDEQALAAVIARMLPAVRGEAAGAVCPGLELEDLMQEGVIGLLRAVRTYAPGAGASFATYARHCIANAVETARRTALRKKHQLLNQAVTLEQHPEADAADPEQIAIDNAQYHSTMHSIHTRLSAFEWQVLQLVLDGYGHAEISTRLGCSRKAAENAMQRVRRKLRDGELA